LARRAACSRAATRKFARAATRYPFGAAAARANVRGFAAHNGYAP